MPPNAFLADSAITRPEDDRLGRAAFARRLAVALQEWRQEDSIVIGLFGPWGSGKTSVVNMALSHLDSEQNGTTQDNNPIVVRFNPWHFSDQGDLLGLFFCELLQGIRKGAPQTFETLKKKLGSLGEVLSSAGDIPVVGGYAKLGAGIAKALTQEASLTELRKEADSAFRDLRRRVIIVMDDVDRLTQQEIRQLFQIIKLNADFPNTVYLIAADRSVVERSLDPEQGGWGRAYLEKIVQVGFDLPLADPVHVSSILEGHLRQAGVPVDTLQYGNLYYSGFRQLFTTLRDVKRFAGALHFTLSMVADEVDVVDFLGVEALRVFLPEVYSAIAQNKDLFISPYDSAYQSGQQSEERKLAVNEILKLAGQKQAVARGICWRLFPQVRGLFNNVSYGREWQSRWRQERRICSEEVFDTYFLLSTRAGDVSRAEVTEIIATASEPARLAELLDKYVEDDRYPRLLSLLPDALESLNKDVTPSFCSLLFATAERQPPRRLRIAGGTVDDDTALVVYRALMRIGEEERYRWFNEQIEHGSLSMVIYQLVTDPADTMHLSEPILNDAQAALVKQACGVKLEERARSGDLINLKHLPTVLLHWAEWASNQEVLSAFLDAQTDSAAGTLDLLAAFTGREFTQGWEDYVGTSALTLDLNLASKVLDLGRLDELFGTVTPDAIASLTDTQQTVLEIYQKTRVQQTAHQRPDDAAADR